MIVSCEDIDNFFMAKSSLFIFENINYDLEATLTSGQTFRWKKINNHWENIISNKYVKLKKYKSSLIAEVTPFIKDSLWLEDYLQINIDLNKIYRNFPKNDSYLDEAVNLFSGLRILKQDPWETIASFICSSNKQIIQIERIIEKICNNFGELSKNNLMSFPSAYKISLCSEDDLMECGMGYRAKYLLKTAQMVSSNKINLNELRTLNYNLARTKLLTLPGVGPKVADCILLFSYGFQESFPVDTWINKAISQLYFKGNPNKKTINNFIKRHFKPNYGYAQQYLFHYMRTFKN